MLRKALPANPVTHAELLSAYDAMWRTVNEVVIADLSRMRQGKDAVTPSDLSAIVSFLKHTRDRLNDLKTIKTTIKPWTMNPVSDEPESGTTDPHSQP